MALIFAQTDSGGAFGNNTSNCGTIVWTSPQSRNCVVGGTLGSTPVSLSKAGTSTIESLTWYSLAPASGVSWDAGTWVYRLNVTVANMSLSIETISICQVDKTTNAAIATIGFGSSLGVSLGSTGVKTINITGSAITPGANDGVIIIIGVTSSSMSLGSVTVVPDQNIDSPFTVPAAFIAKQPKTFLQSVKRGSFY